MQNPVIRQSPASALFTLAAVAAICFVRFATAPFGNEEAAAVQAPLARFLGTFSAAWPVAAVVMAAAVAVAAGVVVGHMCTTLEIYSVKSFLPMPLYGVFACGIFISSNPLAASAASLMTALALMYLCFGYLSDRSLTMMLYAGLSLGVIPLLECSATPWVLFAVVAAIPLFSLSLREITVLTAALLFVPAAVCYISWACGGEFSEPLKMLLAGIAEPSGIDTFGRDAAAALALCGVGAFIMGGSVFVFIDNRFAVAAKPRRILIYILLLATSCSALLFLPSSTPALFAVIAVPSSAVMPILFTGLGAKDAVRLYILLFATLALHLFFE